MRALVQVLHRHTACAGRSRKRKTGRDRGAPCHYVLKSSRAVPRVRADGKLVEALAAMKGVCR